ncbi:MAG TPA: hypothetical protein VM243_10410 [Phycisphaerae bacterium]|nr:hypothetical protein [Phycisphaerae bacterium]
MEPHSVSPRSAFRTFVRHPVAGLVAAGAVTCGLWRAIDATWLCDDAFISFRYARNLVQGLGLVFNQGEWVEGYTNFLWTLWIAAGLAVGCSAELWAQLWGVVCYVGAILLLITNHARLRDRVGAGRFAIPLAAAGAALHGDWCVYATGGLETSCFTFLLLTGYLIIVRAGARPRLLLAGGAIFGLAALTRPDGLLPAVVAGGFVLWRSKPRVRNALLYAGGFFVLWLPFVVWRVGYYGDFFPNSYYAKSAHLTWYGQGWRYVSLYFYKYWALLPALPLTVLVLARSRRSTPAVSNGRPEPQATVMPEAALAAAIAITYTLFVMRVGGDFMFARLLIPVAPFWLILLELGLMALPDRPAAWRVGLIVLVCSGLLLAPSPFDGRQPRYGIADEPAVYTPEFVRQIDNKADVLRRYFDGLPIRVAFYGTDARLVYRSRVAYAVECETGLTDRTLARRPLESRGRVGHEKPAPVPYLVEQCKVHFTFQFHEWNEVLPPIGITFDDVRGRMMRWDPDLLAELKRRGARFVDYPTLLDETIAQLDELTDDQVRAEFTRAVRFYFDWVADPGREAAFRTRLERR